MNPATRLSPLHDALQHSPKHRAACLGEIAGMPAPLHFGDPAAEAVSARTLALADASAWLRLVVKGPRAAEFLQSQGIPIPAEILHTSSLDGGGFVGRTGGAEFFLENGSRGTTVANVEAALGTGREGVYQALRQDASILLSGSQGAEVLRHLSGYDFAIAVQARKLVLTRVANVSCMALARQFNGINVIQLWTDGTYGLYLWEKLLEVVHELGGDVVGLAAFEV